ncbi:hypothetical protein BCON_0031g00110 [Botryotinia convoluta]|uniref:Uncharacterized protein n=1 Tax=Botryotinia convoluta TaxID=54673 RepID=A0A4Z1IKA0_9HELO|nr:hypothetical protein BCON_0031g00110 [Botryotinia convoluta]
MFLSIVTLTAMKALQAMRDIISNDPKSSLEVRFEVLKVRLYVFELDIDIGTDELTGMDSIPAMQGPLAHTLNTAFQAGHC